MNFVNICGEVIYEFNEWICQICIMNKFLVFVKFRSPHHDSLVIISNLIFVK